MSLSPKSDVTIGFIGTGVMGQGMVSNLLKHGYQVLVYSRTKAKAEPLLQQGARWANTVAEVAQKAHVVITMVGYPHDVEDVYLSPEGIVHHARAGTYLIDMTTSKPSLAQTIYEHGKANGLFVLDAPVSGGDVGARNGTLSIMVGGDEAVFQEMEPIFKAMGNKIVLQGPPGAGQHTKMCNQIAIASNMMGVCEALAYAKQAGLDPYTVLESIETGAAGSWSLSNLGPRMIEGDYAPGFYVKHFIKDMEIALEAAKEMGLNTPGLEKAKQLYEQLAQSGEADSGTQALIKLYVAQPEVNS